MAAPAVPAQTADDDEVLAEAALLKSALKPWTGDLDGMVARNMIRVAIPYGIATYFLDGPTQKGVTYDLARSEEHTSELQSLMRSSYAVFCLKQKKTYTET